jgi:hypothetical protein
MTDPPPEAAELSAARKRIVFGKLLGVEARMTATAQPCNPSGGLLGGA